ncbi:uncharacterized protein NECHADRAFT_92265 [Fusarium vanettenii 77-13-4]|uniref:DUF6546 domain-containing protein n=1 Tax=Fusarium vanettenii (strain ATCC MYA-4622 / CBS 123669 / FGSC 9596 / NRRL 45880 / 77-13-4) TaxID=660122 RepID=C7ZFA1_FUSV7|nr:uncharacterized protein NECHADRAFT_92265 [Fusarium vanettenii 77-13-4]EEU37283.1 hypothetical protein NECHADRAFT_92265 [Fusarium vanettenii 77-13-4]
MSGWSSLPLEVRDIILKFLTHDNKIAPYATVSKEWQSVIEKKNFGRLKLHQSCLDSLERLSEQQQGFVKHIWLNIELKTYTCRACWKMESLTSIYANQRILAEAIARLFFILASWKQNRGGLTLELNAYSPSDSEHCHTMDIGTAHPVMMPYDGHLDQLLSSFKKSSLWLKLLSKSVKKVKIFEDFNENYLELFQHSRGRNSFLNPDRVRVTQPKTGAAYAQKSLQLEDFSVAFLIDACHFFDACQPHWRWPHLRSLALTSRLMDKNNPLSIRRILEAAAQSALGMPELETLTLWNGAKGEACAFTWCRQDASISWRGTWDFKLHPSVIKHWEKVAYKYARHEFAVNEELLTQEIRSHGDAIQYLENNRG